MGAALSVVVVAALAPVAFGVGTGRWRPTWMRTTYDLGLVLIAIFLPWYVVWRVARGPAVMIPVAMVALTVAYAAGLLSTLRARRR